MFISFILVLVALVLLSFGADFFVKGASNIAGHLGIPPLIVGLTIVAFGTSAPELFVSVRAVLLGTDGIALGNVVGSNIFNLLVLIGGCSLFAPVLIPKKFRTRDIPMLLIATFLFMALSYDAVFSRIDGIILVSVLMLYLIFLFSKASKGEEEVEVEYDMNSSWPKDLSFVVGGILALAYGSDIFITSASDIARYFGVSEFVIGVTIVSIGTSLPEVATSVSATLKGSYDIAIGNAVGSNIFNILSVVGITAVISDLRIGSAVENFDCYIMLAITLFVAGVCYQRDMVGRKLGIGMLSIYCTFLLMQLL